MDDISWEHAGEDDADNLAIYSCFICCRFLDGVFLRQSPLSLSGEPVSLIRRAYQSTLIAYLFLIFDRVYKHFEI